MKLFEYEGKQLFKKYGIPVPHSLLLTKAARQLSFHPQVVLKAQVLEGDRKKKGLIKIINATDHAKIAKTLLAHGPVLAEEYIDAKREVYVSITIDEANKCFVLLYSPTGGSGVAQTKSVRRVRFSNKNELGTMKQIEPGIRRIAIKMFTLLRDQDATLVEINPLAKTSKGLVALDSKVVIDDNALYRQERWKALGRREQTAVEARAKKQGLRVVELGGDVGIIGDGAGITMALLDELSRRGCKPAFFMDLGGGADRNRIRAALRIANDLKVKRMFITIFGGITDCMEVARGMAAAPKNLVVRLRGTREEEARALLARQGIALVDTIEEGMEYVCAK